MKSLKKALKRIPGKFRLKVVNRGLLNQPTNHGALRSLKLLKFLYYNFFSMLFSKQLFHIYPL